MKVLNLVLIVVILFVVCKKEVWVVLEFKLFVIVMVVVVVMDKDIIFDKFGLKFRLYQDSIIFDEIFIIFNYVLSLDYVFNEDVFYLNGFGYVNIVNILCDGIDLVISSLLYFIGMFIGLDIYIKLSGLFFLRISGLYKMLVDK